MGKGKRNPSIVISSTDDEVDTGVTLKSRSKPTSVPRVRNPKKRPKKGSLSNSSYRSCRESDFNDFDAIKQFCDEFDEGIRGFKEHTGRGMSMDLWVDRYKRHSLEELAVHKKKVEEVKTLFEERFIALEGSLCNYVILFAGLAGVRKSYVNETLQLPQYGKNICTPVVQSFIDLGQGLRYTSKLHEFETFVERIRKYGFISSCVSGKSRVILLIDDLPIVNGKVSYERLQRCLHLLVQSVSVPTVI